MAKPYVDPARFKTEQEFVAGETKRIMASIRYIREGDLKKKLSQVWKIAKKSEPKEVE